MIVFFEVGYGDREPWRCYVRPASVCDTPRLEILLSDLNDLAGQHTPPASVFSSPKAHAARYLAEAIANLLPRLDTSDRGFPLDGLSDATLASIFLGPDCLIRQVHRVRPGKEWNVAEDGAPIVLTGNAYPDLLAQLTVALGSARDAIAICQTLTEQDVQDYLTAIAELRRDPHDRNVEYLNKVWQEKVVNNPKARMMLMGGSDRLKKRNIPVTELRKDEGS